MINVHMFWAYGQVSQLETLAMRSFVHRDYNLHVWSYDMALTVPGGVHLCDAREILDEKMVFKNQVGSYASFSDLFRYALLASRGGLYVDTDVIALRHSSEFSNVNMLVSEKRITESKISAGVKVVLGLQRYVKSRVAVNNNVINCPDPNDCGIIRKALEIAREYPKDRITWGELGPILLSRLVDENPGHGFVVQDVDYANPIAYWRCPEALLDPHEKLSERAFFLHCYSEMWRWKRVSKDQIYSTGSLLHVSF